MSDPRIKLEIRPTRNRGRGVFARIRFEQGEIVEAVPVIVIPREQIPHVVATVIDLYAFKFGEEEEHLAIALGYGSLYNHSFSPNARFVTSWSDQQIRFVALRDIAAGEEITVNYNGDPEDQTPIWFDAEE
jgi:SET domain-containing protein